MRLCITLALALLMASPAYAINGWTKCGATASAGTYPAVASNTCMEFRFDSSVGSSAIFRVNAEEALVCLDPDIAQVGALGSAAVMVQRCTDLTDSSSLTANNCDDILAAALDGTPGAAGTQNACVRVARGTYRLVITAAGGGETALLTVQGEK